MAWRLRVNLILSWANGLTAVPITRRRPLGVEGVPEAPERAVDRAVRARKVRVRGLVGCVELWSVRKVGTVVNPFQFIQEVRQEVAKVTWPSRKELWVTTVAVLVMVMMASLFFLLVDQAIGALVSFVLSVGR